MSASRRFPTMVLSLTAVVAGSLISCSEPPPPPEETAPALVHVRLGTDRLADSLPSALVGKNVGLITNHSGADREGKSTIDILFGRTDMKLVALFAPEHGIRGELSGSVENTTDSVTGLPVFSLHGETYQPTDEMMKGVDALVFDVQDVGVRQYTYPSTMAYGMKTAAEKKIPFVVLDRPTPVTGTIVEGNLLDTAFTSFVGFYPIASRHGMTVGELAKMFNEAFGIGCDLTVVPMEGWTRDLWIDETDLPWKKPSPNLPTLEGVYNYPGTVLFEGTSLSEGRGTEKPFEYIGAPWLNAAAIADSMNALGLPGVRFEALDYTFAENARKYPGELAHGVRFVITDREAYRPIAASLLFMEMAKKMHPDDFTFRGRPAEGGQPASFSLDRLSGTDKTRAAIDAGTMRELLAQWEQDAARFIEMRKPYLLY
ncbi:MAG TPA: DUF1343 domain-containing protein [Longimicrobiales bacterium]|nr:DUF1343 domain-containing protein [Longimicrobiales bacterium]